MSQSKLTKAIHFAADVYDFSSRSMYPYILTPFKMMSIALTMTFDEDVLTAALLMEVTTIGNASPRVLLSEFGFKVALLVVSVMDDIAEHDSDAEKWGPFITERRLEKIKKANRAEKILHLSRELTDMRDKYLRFIKEGVDMWDDELDLDDYSDGNERRAGEGRYYRKVAELLRNELGTTDAWREFNNLVESLYE